MKVFLQGSSGPGIGARLEAQERSPVSIGRSLDCTFALANDRFISGRHLEVTVVDGKPLLRDLGSTNGTFVNGERVRELLLHDGDSILAGESVFTVRLDSGEAPQVPGVLDVLSRQQFPLYAVLDTARDAAIYPLLLGSGAPHWSLYQGKSALELEAYAPYLVYLPPQSELLKTIVEKGWGLSWGVFLTSPYPPETIWHEMRRFLMVTLESTGKMVYFRFYDPRVLRMFLPITNEEQRAHFARVGNAFLAEGEEPDLLIRYQPQPQGCHIENVLVQQAAT